MAANLIPSFPDLFKATIAAASCLLISWQCFGAGTFTLIPQESNGQRVVMDPANGRAWFWDLGRFSNQTYSQQEDVIQDLNAEAYFGLTGWHLATAPEMETLFALDDRTVRQLFHPSHERYEGSFEWHYWGGRFDSTSSSYLHMCVQSAWGTFVWGPFDFGWPQTFSAVDSSAFRETGAWAVAMVPIPEPSVLALMALGVLAGSMRDKGRSSRSNV
jgi:hypothetical protein